MKNFEERYTAWLDGVLDEAMQEEFEALLDAQAHQDAAGWKKLRGLMRESLVPAFTPHADFINSQVLAEIHRETPRPKRQETRGTFGIRLAWAGASLLALAIVLSAIILPQVTKPPTADQYISQVIEARSSDPTHAAVAFEAPGGKGAVLWVENAGYIPANEKIK
jgi:anti-sigma factor RsiW